MLEASVREWGWYLRDRKEKAGKVGRGGQREKKRMRETRTRADLTSPCCSPHPHGPSGVTKVSQEELTPEYWTGASHSSCSQQAPPQPLNAPPQPPISTQTHSSHPPGRGDLRCKHGPGLLPHPCPWLRASIHEKHQRRGSLDTGGAISWPALEPAVWAPGGTLALRLSLKRPRAC